MGLTRYGGENEEFIEICIEEMEIRKPACSVETEKERFFQFIEGRRILELSA